MYENEVKRSIDIAYSKYEMFEKLQKLRTPDLTRQNTIYIITNEVSEFHALARDTQIQIVTTHGIRNHIKALFTKETPIEKAIRRMQLSKKEEKEYMEVIKKGGMVLVSGADPFNESEWTGHTLTKWITNQKNPSNLFIWGLKEIYPVTFKPQRAPRMPDMAVAGEFGIRDKADKDKSPLQDDQCYIRDPMTGELGIYQAPHKNG
ncbi:serine/threonine protein kinase [Solibacillus sp. R5-41]|uniref:general stress protein n=1 Tax=Solibacillus sp. R5-41 TaxID=2048654 RepID=UPI000C127093|nr:general stress protein [Solibacillus sp. R5-41]ATP38851.1 serine/threonine protein kinase [Solibacillus sp. R5-41]